MNTECPICMDTITSNSNCCTTECNHTFHSSCLFKNFATSNGCPLCRKELVQYPEDDEDDEDDEYENDDDEEDEEEYKPMFISEQIHAVIKKKGFTETDLMNSIILSHYHNTKLIPMEDEMWDKHEKLFELLTSIANKEISVDYRDSRTYANVIQGQARTNVTGKGPDPVF